MDRAFMSLCPDPGFAFPHGYFELRRAATGAFVVFMGIEYRLGKHGGGVHQWDTILSDAGTIDE